MADPVVDLATARVFAPGMTCVYDQLFSASGGTRWMAHRFKNDFDGATDRLELRGDPLTLMAQVMAGNLAATSHLFMNGDAMRAELGDRVEYDVLAVESRWLLYSNSLLSFTDWPAFERAVSPMFDRTVYYFDVDYAHAGTLFDLSLVRPVTAADVATWERRSALKHRLLNVLAKFSALTYVDVSAMAANVGYVHTCVDQIDHYTPGFRQLVGGIFAQDRDGSAHRANASVLERLKKRVGERQTDFEFVSGMMRDTAAGGDLLTVRVTIHADDPLVCPTQLLISWRTRVGATIDWSEFVIRDGLFNTTSPLRPDWLVEYVHQLVNIKTAGCFEVQVHE